ncbi:hypothetical protein CJI52_03600, partial [Bifidobacteriaceae bacterium WP022]
MSALQKHSYYAIALTNTCNTSNITSEYLTITLRKEVTMNHVMKRYI